MRPKTKIQVAVYNLSNNLPKLTKDQENYITSKLFEKRCFATKNRAFCLECGNDIDVNTINRKRVVCPYCQNKLKVEFTRKIKDSTGSYIFAVASLVKNELYDFQLVRNFEIRRHYRKGE
jgi:ABC-type ATPase with predicted acetyltransferase domain